MYRKVHYLDISGEEIMNPLTDLCKQVAPQQQMLIEQFFPLRKPINQRRLVKNSLNQNYFNKTQFLMQNFFQIYSLLGKCPPKRTAQARKKAMTGVGINGTGQKSELWYLVQFNFLCQGTWHILEEVDNDLLDEDFQSPKASKSATNVHSTTCLSDTGF
jgi:hypothetical protein